MMAKLMKTLGFRYPMIHIVHEILKVNNSGAKLLSTALLLYSPDYFFYKNKKDSSTKEIKNRSGSLY